MPQRRPQDPPLPASSLGSSVWASQDARANHTLQHAPASSAWGPQDARSNLAVQPAKESSSFKLKKNAVKIVGAATTTPSARSSPVQVPIKPDMTDAEGRVPATPTPALMSMPSQKENIKSKDDSQSTLDALYARLTSATATASSLASPRASDKDMFSFDDGAVAANIKKGPALSTTKPDLKKEFPDKFGVAKEEKAESDKVFKDAGKREPIKQEELENEYMSKASAWVVTLPDSKGQMGPAQLIKIVSTKLRSSYILDDKGEPEKTETIRKRFAYAIANYLNKVLKKHSEPRTTDSVKQTLKEENGDFLRVCAKLVDEKYFSLETIDEITGLVKNILDILPKSELCVAQVAKETKVVPENPANEAKPVLEDLVAKSTAWPTQEKREDPAPYRTCVLKGISGVKNIRQLQALVWGGKLESIVMPEPGSTKAIVKFLTPAACERYLRDTVNGIEVIVDMKKTVIFVEKAEGPNSINDVIRNCIEYDASRCVRVIGTEKSDDMALVRLARGKGNGKRDLERIQRGKTALGHSYVEFRFANIYHALNFKREFLDDEDWEHCNIRYAPDPCELAQGVHYEDEDEDDSGAGGFFA
ncbi:hypothetical protein BDW02DRAFT_505226 [Decorospora gaudefroyi]|uniref:Uncharacterized protein n=1 Tax=Decorospora gaudefroyi TaxID=184978 RepID=A0A6A5K1E6_9PLEO|nr:hypothetical protein BDW02DRAFT_505226 [Decorospora gaudefroyi]